MTIVMCEQPPGYGPPAPVHVCQWEVELTPLLDLYRERRPQRTLEIGTFHGGTLFHWLQNAPQGAVVVSVDSYGVGIDNRHLYGDWTPDGVTLHAIKGDSSDPATVADVATLGPFGWVFIDAGHSYDEVSADWDAYGPMCDPGGVVCFHDINPAQQDRGTIEVDRLWREIVAAGYETREFLGGAQGGGIGVVYL